MKICVLEIMFMIVNKNVYICAKLYTLEDETTSIAGTIKNPHDIR